MKLGLSTLLFPNKKPDYGVKIASKLDLDYVEVIFDMPHFNPENGTKKLDKLRETIESLGLKTQVHGRFWDLNPISQYAKLREISLERTIESIEACNIINGNIVTVHPGRCWFKNNEKLLESCKEQYFNYIQESEKKAKELDITLAIETGADRADYPFELEEFKRFSKSFESVGITLDVGHSFIKAYKTEKNEPEKKIIQIIKELGKNLVNVHLHDNHGKLDSHLTPGEGKINLNKILNALETHYDGPVILELWNPSNPNEAAEKGVKRVKKELESL